MWHKGFFSPKKSGSKRSERQGCRLCRPHQVKRSENAGVSPPLMPFLHFPWLWERKRTKQGAFPPMMSFPVGESPRGERVESEGKGGTPTCFPLAFPLFAHFFPITAWRKCPHRFIYFLLFPFLLLLFPLPFHSPFPLEATADDTQGKACFSLFFLRLFVFRLERQKKDFDLQKNNEVFFCATLKQPKP